MVCAYCLVTLDDKSINDNCGKNNDPNEHLHSNFIIFRVYL